MEIFKENIRYILAFLTFLLIILINKSFFIYEEVDLNCFEGKCETSLQETNLTDENPVLFVNDSINTETNYYFRFSFRYSSNNNSKISVRVSTPLDEQQELAVLDIHKTNNEKYQEFVFKSNGSFSDAIFEKINKNDKTEIFISNVQATKLDIKSELEELKSTVIGQADFFAPDQKQTEDASFDFDQLKEKGIVLGQVFKPESEYMTGITLDISCQANSINDRQKFILELREVDFDGEVAEIEKNPLVELNFSLKDLEKYRQEDGKFNFPIFYPLSKDRYYFIGINNKKAEASDNYYLIIRGSKEGSRYSKGKAVLKRGSRTIPVMGSLYFITYGSKFSEFGGKKILSNVILEDIGRGKLLYSYQIKGLVSDLVDLDSQTGGVKYDSGKKVIFGETIEENPKYIYKFDTIYPFQEIRLKARQVDPNWSQVKIAYSFDEKDWIDIPFSIKDTLQSFNWNFKPDTSNKIIYVRISPNSWQEDQDKFGITDFKFEADLIAK